MAPRGLLLALDYSPAAGGIARLLEGWSMDTDEMEWLVLTTTPGPRSERVVRTSLRAMPLAAVLRGRQWLRQAEDRVVVASHPYLSGLAVAIAKSSGARSAFIAHGSELLPRRLAHRLALAPLIFTDIAVCVSSHTAELVRRRAWRQHPHVTVLHPMLRSPWLVAAASRRRPATGLRLVTISRLVEGHKNFEMLIRLCAVLHPLGIVDRLTIVGGGPRLSALRHKVAALGLGHVIDLPGHLPAEEVAAILGSSDVGILASRNSPAERVFEGFGLVVHELAGAGIPVLTGAAGGTVEAVHEPWGRKLDPDDLWAWVQAIEQLYAAEGQRLEMGAAALAWAGSIDTLDSARAFARVLLEGDPSHEQSRIGEDRRRNLVLGARRR